MPAQRTTRTSTKPASTPRATSRTTAKPADSTDRAIRKVVEQETAKGTSSRSNGKAPATRRAAKEAQFRAITLISETYLDIDGVSGDFDLTICSRCAAVVPSHERAQEAHRKFHDAIDGLGQRA